MKTFLKDIAWALPVAVIVAGIFLAAVSALSVQQPLLTVPASKSATATLQPAETVYNLQPAETAQQLQPTYNPQQTVNGADLQ